ncbi:MAG: flagellar motor protein MotB [Marinilabiliaceae bacterium]|nr:flagellar motor protein MotB [Marinilabiliaceae bacterium]
MIKSIKKYIAVLAISITYMATTKAQSPLSLYYLETIPQSHHDNAAMAPRANAYISVVSFNYSLFSDVSMKDFLQQTGSEWVTPLHKEFDYGEFYDVMGDALNMGLRGDISALGFGFRSGRDYLSFQFSEKAVIQTGFSSDFFKLPDAGLPKGAMFDFSTMRLKAYAYKEFSIGYARELTDRLTVGVHVKPLFGQAIGMTDISNMSLSIGENQYDIRVNGDIYTSLPMDVYSKSGEFPDSIEFKELESDDYLNNYGTSFRNPGLALDFGGEYKFSDRWSFSAAFNNLGFIHWSEDLNALHTEGAYAYDGVEVSASNWDDLGEVFDDVADELKETLTYNHTQDAFTSGLTPNMYLGAEYHVNHAISFGGLSRTTFQKQNWRQEFALSLNYNPYRFMALNVNLNTRIKGSTYMGACTMWYIGPLQFFLMVDNVPFHLDSYYDDNGNKTPIPGEFKDLNLMAGINLVFGSKGFRDKPMIGKNK